MDQPIMLSPQDIFTIIVAVCGAIVTVSAAMSVISKAINKTKEPDKKQDERITALEEHVKKIDDRLALGNQRFQSDKDRADNMELAMKESNRVIIESLQALTVHALDGNNVEELRNAKKQLTEYLLNR